RALAAVRAHHHDRSETVDRGWRDEPHRRVRPRRTLFVRLGRPGRTARTVQRSALDYRRSGRESVSRRSFQRSRAEIPAEAWRGSGEVSGTGTPVFSIGDKLETNSEPGRPEGRPLPTVLRARTRMGPAALTTS